MYTCGALTALRSPDKVDLLDCLETRVCSGVALPDGWNETLFADAIDVRPRSLLLPPLCVGHSHLPSVHASSSRWFDVGWTFAHSSTPP